MLNKSRVLLGAAALSFAGLALAVGHAGPGYVGGAITSVSSGQPYTITDVYATKNDQQADPSSVVSTDLTQGRTLTYNNAYHLKKTSSDAVVYKVTFSNGTNNICQVTFDSASGEPTSVYWTAHATKISGDDRTTCDYHDDNNEIILNANS